MFALGSWVLGVLILASLLFYEFGPSVGYVTMNFVMRVLEAALLALDLYILRVPKTQKSNSSAQISADSTSKSPNDSNKSDSQGLELEVIS